MTSRSAPRVSFALLVLLALSLSIWSYAPASYAAPAQLQSHPSALPELEPPATQPVRTLGASPGLQAGADGRAIQPLLLTPANDERLQATFRTYQDGKMRVEITAAAAFLALPGVDRCFLALYVDDQRIGDNVEFDACAGVFQRHETVLLGTGRHTVRLKAWIADRSGDTIIVEPVQVSHTFRVARATTQVSLSITRFQEIERPDCTLFPRCPNRGDYYARITIGGKLQRIPPSQAVTGGDISPNWVFVQQVDLTSRTIPVRIEIIDDDVDEDDRMDVSPRDGEQALNLSFDLADGTWSGDVSSPQSYAQGDGDRRSGADGGDKGKVWFDLRRDYNLTTVNVDIPLAAANRLLSTAYYTSRFPTAFNDSYTAAGAFQAAVTMYRPGPANVRIDAGNLYVELAWRVRGAFTVDDKTVRYDRLVPIRLGLKQDRGLRFVAGEIQILDQTVPLPLQGIIRKELARRLLSASDLLVTTSAIVNALPTTTLSLESSTVAYELWLDRPQLRSVPAASLVPSYRLALDLGLHALLSAEVHVRGSQEHYDTLYHRIDLALAPTARVDYTLTDSSVDLVAGSVNDLLAMLPARVRKRAAQLMGDLRLPLYSGRLVDLVNASLPDQLDLVLIDAGAQVQVLRDRVRLSAQVGTRGSPSQIDLAIHRSSASIALRLNSNVRLQMRSLALYDAGGRLIKRFDNAELRKGESLQVVWDRRNPQGQPTARNDSLSLRAMFYNDFDYHVRSWTFFGVGTESGWQPISPAVGASLADAPASLSAEGGFADPAALASDPALGLPAAAEATADPAPAEEAPPAELSAAEVEAALAQLPPEDLEEALAEAAEAPPASTARAAQQGEPEAFPSAVVPAETAPAEVVIPEAAPAEHESTMSAELPADAPAAVAEAEAAAADPVVVVTAPVDEEGEPPAEAASAPALGRPPEQELDGLAELPADALSVSVSEASLNAGLRTLTRAGALGVYNDKDTGGRTDYSLQVVSASIDLRAGNRVTLTTDLKAKANVNVAVAQFAARLSCQVQLPGEIKLRPMDSAGYRLFFQPKPDVAFRCAGVPRLLTDLVELGVNGFVHFKLSRHGGLPLDAVTDLLPRVPENDFIASQPLLEVSDSALTVALTPKSALPDLAVAQLEARASSGGYRVHVTVANRAQAGAPAMRNFTVRIFGGDPDLNRDGRLDSPLPAGVVELAAPGVIDVLAVGETRQHSFGIVAPGRGTSAVYAVVDGEDRVLELSESNNGARVLNLASVASEQAGEPVGGDVRSQVAPMVYLPTVGR